MSPHAQRTAVALALQALALGALMLALLGTSWLDPRTGPRWLVLVDRSLSMPEEPTAQALAALAAVGADAGATLRALDFAATVAAGESGPTVDATLDRSGTDIEAALQAAHAVVVDAVVFHRHRRPSLGCHVAMFAPRRARRQGQHCVCRRRAHRCTGSASMRASIAASCRS